MKQRPELDRRLVATLVLVPALLVWLVDDVPRFVYASCSYYTTCDPATFTVTALPDAIALDETSSLEGSYAECPCNWSIDSQPGGWEVVAGTDCKATLQPIDVYGNAGTIVVRCDSGTTCSETVSVEAGTSTFRVQGSINGGTSWASEELAISGKPGESVDLALRVTMTVTNDYSEGWSYSMKHSAGSIESGGGALDLLSVITTGTHTETVQDGNPPDFEDTAIRTDAAGEPLGITQGVVIDYDGTAITLDPVLDFVTAGACYNLIVPAQGSYQATFFLTDDVGDGEPPIESVITQQSEDIDPLPALRTLTLTVYSDPSYAAPPGDCNATWVTQNDGIVVPPSGTSVLAGIGPASPPLTRRIPPGVSPDDGSRNARITPDGKYVVFASRATNLDPGNIDIPLGAQGKLHIYRFDRDTESLLHLSKDTQGEFAEEDSIHPSVSDDGQRVVFDSLEDLDQEADTNLSSDIYVRDMRGAGDETRLLSVDPADGEAPDGTASILPSLSGDGEFVLYSSQEGRLDPDDGFPLDGDSFVYRVPADGGASEFVSFAPHGEELEGVAATGEVSDADGIPATLNADEIRLSFVGDVLNTNGDAAVFQADEPLASLPDQVFLRDFDVSPPQTMVASEDPLNQEDGFARRPAISQDASRLVYTFTDDAATENREIHFEDITLDQNGNRTIDVNAGGVVGAGDGDASRAMVSDDGSFVSFTSEATDLLVLASDTNGVSDVFLTPLDANGVTRRESVSSAGLEGDMASLNADLAILEAEDEAVLVFESDATNLIADDTNGFRDVFDRRSSLAFVPFERGDVDSSGAIDITDPIVTLGFLFQGGVPPDCDDAADSDDSGDLNITDAIRLLNWLFRAGDPPAEPFGECGTDPTADGLDCASPSAACS